MAGLCKEVVGPTVDGVNIARCVLIHVVYKKKSNGPCLLAQNFWIPIHFFYSGVRQLPREAAVSMQLIGRASEKLCRRPRHYKERKMLLVGAEMVSESAWKVRLIGITFCCFRTTIMCLKKYLEHKLSEQDLD